MRPVFTLEYGDDECGCALKAIYASQSLAEAAAFQLMDELEKPFSKESDFGQWRYTEDENGCTSEITRIWHTAESYKTVLIRAMEIVSVVQPQEEPSK